jgi:hypothetical protein
MMDAEEHKTQSALRTYYHGGLLIDSSVPRSRRHYKIQQAHKSNDSHGRCVWEAGSWEVLRGRLRH